MDVLQFLSSLAWPAVVVFVVILLRDALKELLGRVVEAEALGGKVKFDPKAAEPSVALAKAEAAASAPARRRGRANEKVLVPGRPPEIEVRARKLPAAWLLSLARKDPGAAVLSAYAAVEKALRERMHEAHVAGVEGLSGVRLIEVAERKGVISGQIGQAIRDIRDQRNIAAHGGRVEEDQAVEYLNLADSVQYSIATWRRS